MARRRSFITLLWFVIYSLGMPLADNDDNDDDDGDSDGDDACSTAQPMVVADSPVDVPESPPAAILAPYEQPPIPHPSPSQNPHATLPVSHRSQTSTILGSVFGALVTLVALSLIARCFIRRRRSDADPFRDPSKSRFTVFRARHKSTGSKKRLSDESWVSPVLPALGSPGSPLSHDLELSRYAIQRRKLVPVTTPVCTPTDTEFGSRLEFRSGDPNSTSGSVVLVPTVRVPSPVYISPFSPSPSLSSSTSSLSPAPSTEPLTSPTPEGARLSCLLSSNFGITRVRSPTRPTTAHLIDTARSYAHAYRPPSATSTSLYTPPNRGSGARSRVSFYPEVRDMGTIQYLFRATQDASPFADPAPGGTQLGLRVRLSDASEHARYRQREKEREQERERARGM